MKGTYNYFEIKFEGHFNSEGTSLMFYLAALYLTKSETAFQETRMS